MRDRREHPSEQAARAADLGFRTLNEEVTDRKLPVTGTVPSWLSGALIRNGPGRFEFGGRRATHWFDGLALLRRYGFEDGEIRYTNRFLRSEAYAAANDGEAAGQFASDVGTLGTIRRWVKSLGPPEPTDNANVHVARIGEEFVALTEAPRRMAFDPVSLETRGEFDFDDDLNEHLAAAHLAVDPTRGETVGFATEFGRPHQYHLYRLPAGETSRDRIASVPAEGPGYVHDIAVTPDHIVLVEPPLRISVLGVFAPWNDGLLDALDYDSERDARFVVVDRDTGAIVAEWRTRPFFVFHHVNAYEDGDDLVVDLVEFEDDSIVRSLALDSLTAEAFTAAPNGRLVRYRLPLDGGDISRRRRYDGGLELPTVPRAVRGRAYSYAYAQVTDRQGANGLVKIDVESETATEWWERGLYVEEPRMVQRPDGSDEDDGVVLAPALDTESGRTVLLVFDAETLTELARAPLPHAVPFGFHGRFFAEK